ncbi:CAP Gly-rich domain protein [Raphanus sativus]|nr:CAP Gly-rich domain protein [Raphanus sativus]
MKVFHLDRENTLSVSLFSDVTNSNLAIKPAQKALLSSGSLKYLGVRIKKFKNTKDSNDSSFQQTKEDFMEDNIKVGDRCQVEPGEKRGVVKYVGRAESLGPGYWVGIQYDEPLGKHDGIFCFLGDTRSDNSFPPPSQLCSCLPLSLLKTAQGHPMLVELKNGETYNGQLL